MKNKALIVLMKNIIKICFVIIVFVSIYRYLDYVYVDYDAWRHILFYSYYSQDENIDNLFLGSSHVYCDVNPYILDEINDQNNFNMATPGQRWDETYYLLKMAADDNELCHVYIECYYMDNTEHKIWDVKKGDFKSVDYIDDPGNYSRAWQTSYEMRPGIYRLMLQMNASDQEHIIENCFPFMRYRQNLFDWSHLKDTLETKQGEDYINYEYCRENIDANGTNCYIKYYPKGWHYSNIKVQNSEKMFGKSRDLSCDRIGAKSRKYMNRTIAFCREKNIPVILFISPIYDTQLISTVDYDSYYAELKTYAQDQDVELYDFNLVKQQYLDIKDGRYFMDIGHLNCYGAEMYTPLLWEILNGDRDSNADKFYQSYNERLANEQFELYGLYYEDCEPDEDNTNGDGSPVYTMRRYYVASNRFEDVSYRITKTYNDQNAAGQVIEKTDIIQTFDSNDSFLIPIGMHGTITVTGKYNNDLREIKVDF